MAVYSARFTQTLLVATGMTTYFTAAAGETWVLMSLFLVNQDPAAQSFTMDNGVGSRPVYLRKVLQPDETFERGEMRLVIPAGVSCRFGATKANVIALTASGYRLTNV